LEIKRKKMSTIVLILFFCPNHAINWRPLKRKKKFWLFSNLTVCQKAQMPKGTMPKGTMPKGTKPKGTKLKGTNFKKGNH